MPRSPSPRSITQHRAPRDAPPAAQPSFFTEKVRFVIVATQEHGGLVPNQPAGNAAYTSAPQHKQRAATGWESRVSFSLAHLVR